MQLHGGTLEVFSAGEGKGCSFCFKIPMTRGSAAEGSQGRVDVNVNGAAGDGKDNDNDNEDREDDRASGVPSPYGPYGPVGPSDGHHHDADDGNEGNEGALSTPRHRARGGSTGSGANARNPSPAAVMRPSWPTLRQQSPPQQQHRSVKVAVD